MLPNYGRADQSPGFERHSKGGVPLLDLVPGSLYQGELDLELETTGQRINLMAAIDALNVKYGKGTVYLASSGIDGRTRQWGMRRERLTPGYMTAWADMPVAKAV